VKGGERRRGDGATGRPRDATTRRGGAELLKISPADTAVVAYLVVIALLILIFSYRIESWGWLCAGHAVVIALVVSLAKWDHTLPSLSRPVASFIHDWYPVALMGLTYKELTYLIPRIHPRDFDSVLAAIDHRIFGVNPTVWLERFTWPPLTEVLQLTYSSYYFLPLILGVVLWKKNTLAEFHFLVFIVVLGFYVSYLGYIAVPAIGPRFLPSIADAQTTSLTGLLFFQPVRRMLDSVEGITRDCFPSGHTELTLLVLYYARKFHRRTFWCLLPFGIGIVLSTVYLRYHYVVDVAAGALVALAIVAITTPLYNNLTTQESQSA
jgi:membrane-associated phospholipid phosphatase